MGHTFIPQSVFHDFLREVSPKYSPDKYDLIHNNCNNFTNEATQFLLGKKIPDFITGLPHEFLKTPFGQMVQPIIQNMQNQALANFGDYAGMGIAAEPHLPNITPMYDKFIGESDAESSDNDNNDNNDNDKDTDVVMKNSNDNNNNDAAAQSKDENEQNTNANANGNDKDNTNENENKTDNDSNNNVKVNDSKDSLMSLVKEHCSNHKHFGLNNELKIIGKTEYCPKLTLDNKNAKLYAEMVVDSVCY